MTFYEYKRFITALFSTLSELESNLTPEDVKEERTDHMDVQDWMFEHENFIDDSQGEAHD